MKKDVYELTNPQKSIWLTEEFYKGTAINNICGNLIIREKVDFDKFETAINLFVKTNESFRLKFFIEDSIPKQYVSDFSEFKLDIIDVKSDDEIAAIQKETASEVFEVLNSLLFKFKIVRLPDGSGGFIINAHHLISDAATFAILATEIVKIYSSLTHNTEFEYNTNLYTDYIKSEQVYMHSEKFKKDEAYWNGLYSNVPEVASIPSLLKKSDTNSLTSLREDFIIPKELFEKINVVCKKNRISSFNLFMAVYAIYLGRVSNLDEFVIGTPILNRTNFSEKNTSGMFISTAPFKISIDHKQTFADFAKKIGVDSLSMLRHQKYPYQFLLENLRKNGSNVPNLYDFMFSYQITKATDKNLEIPYTTHWTGNDKIANSLEVHAHDNDSNGTVTIAYDYKTSKHTKEDIINLHNRILCILEQIIDNPNISLKDIEIVTEEEKNKILYEFNDTKVDYPKDKTIVQLFEEQVKKTPDNIAVVFEDQKLTYKELNEKANQLALYLKTQNSKPESVVGLFLDKSLEMIVSILAIFKSGLAFLPIDIDYPKDRISYMIQNSDTKLILTTNDLLNNCSFNVKTISVDLTNDNIYKTFAKFKYDYKCSSNNLAYIMYTSGSTGNPKGVMIEQKSIIRLVKNTNYIDFDVNEKILQTGSIVFDACTFEIWSALLNGFELYLIKKETLLNSSLLQDYLFKNKITTLWLTAPLFNQLVEENPHMFGGVKHLLTGGDVLSPKHINMAKTANPNLTIINGYGPTENTTFSTCFTIDKLYTDSIPIGKPIANSTCYIVSKSGNLQPIGVPGELWVGGDGVGRGYLNNIELTQEKFIDFDLANDFIYKTGDLVKWLPDGNIDFLGRIDSQIKLRGFRIELSEINQIILKYNNIKDSTTIVTNINNEKVICSYIVSDEKIDINMLQDFLCQNLPIYMIPTYIMQIDRLPINTNGKIDKNALPKPQGTINSQREIILPRNDIDKKLIDILKSLLKTNNISISDSLVSIGIDSLSSIRLLAQIQNTFGTNLSVKDILSGITVKKLSDIISINKKNSNIETISPADIMDFYPVSSAQRRIYYSSKVAGDGTTYNIPGGLILSEMPDIQKLENCFNEIIQKHESLRTYFDVVNGEVVQKIRDKINFKIDFDDDICKNKYVAFTDFVKPFDLAKAPLLRAKLVKLENKKALLLFDMHHIISDGTSMQILIDELCKLYNGETLSPLEITYKDYSVWEQNNLKQNKFKESEKFWVNQFESDIPVLNLPTNCTRPSVQSFEGGNIYKQIDKELTEKINDLAKELNITPYMLLLSCYYILLYKYTSNTDIIVGTPIVGRDNAQTNNMIGMFVNSLPLRKKINSNESFLEFSNHVKETCLNAFEHQTYPFDELVSKLNIKRDSSRNPLFDTMFIYQNEGNTKVNLGNIKSKYYIPDSNISKFDLSLEIVPENDKLNLRFEYATKLFNKEFIEYLSTHYINILKIVLENSDIKIADIEMLSEEEKEKILYDFNNTKVDYPKDKTIVQLFEEQVEKTPDNIAVVFEDQKLTYRELNEKANQLAWYLRENGIKQGDIVCVCMNKNLDFIISILGIQKAGAAYLPIHPDYPNDRISYIIQNSKSKLLISNVELQEFHIKFKEIPLDNYTCNNLSTQIDANFPAYVIYTSGSTGNPKGVVVSHLNLINFIYSFNNQFNNKFTNEDNCLSLTNISFDVSVCELFTPILFGATLVLYSENTLTDIHLLVNTFEKRKITFTYIPPNILLDVYDYIKNNNSKIFINKLLVGVEAIKNETLNKYLTLNSNMEIINGYGPTETTICATFYKYTFNNNINNTVPIGTALDNNSVLILDKDMNISPFFSIGEIYISGNNVSNGYLFNPDLTQSSFIQHNNILFYKTGDLGFLDYDGNISFVGRNDSQIKFKGYRIELGEINNTIKKISSIQNSYTLIKKLNGNEVLCSYVVADNQEITTEFIKKELKSKLPYYMIPNCIVILDKFPLTINGKIDKNNLPEININNKEIVLPRTETERKLYFIWQKILKTKNISVYDNFFDLGGDSLCSIRLISEISNEFNFKIKLNDIFNNGILFDLALFIDNASNKNKIINILKTDISDFYPTSSAQKRIYYSSKVAGDGTAYNMPGGLILSEIPDKQKLEKCFNEVISKHETLRTYFDVVSGEVVQKIRDKINFKIDFDDEICEDKYSAFTNFVKPFDLSKAPLIRAKLVKLEKNQALLLFDMHHIISDGTSMQILINELCKLYNGESLSPLEITYKDYSVWEQNNLKENKLKQSEKYWLNMFKDDDIPVLNLPTNYARPSVQSFEGGNIYKQLDKELTEKLNNLSKELNITPYMLLLSCYYILLYKYTSNTDIIVGTPIVGRDNAQTNDMIGMFVNSLPLRKEINSNESFLEFSNCVKEMCLNAFEHQTYPFDELVRKLNIKRDSSRNPLFDTMFIYQNEGNTKVNLGNIKSKYYIPDSNISKFDLSLEVIPENNKLNLRFEYATKLFNKEFIEYLSTHYINILKTVLENTDIKIADIDMLSLEEKNKILYEFNDTKVDYPKDKTIVQIFEEQVEKTPDNIAVIFEDQKLTYKELNEKANSLAISLINQNTKPNDIIGILLPRSLDLIISIWGVLKAGAGYMLIDHNLPNERIKYMLKNANAHALITYKDFKNIKYNNSLYIDNLEKEDCKNLNLTLSNENNLAVIYTSGSTGEPKGVLLKQLGIINLIHSFIKEMKIDKFKNFLSIAAVSFDMFTVESMCSLLMGKTLILSNEEEQKDPYKLGLLSEKYPIDFLITTPSRMDLFLSQEKSKNMIANLKAFQLGGEIFSSTLFEKLSKITTASMYNGYGPTEITACCSNKKVTNAENISIGKPLNNTNILILDKDNNLCPINVPGELCVLGDGVSKGYINNEEATNKVFIKTKYFNKVAYKTGDIAKSSKNGELVYLGRNDNQIKIRGLRIELSEIENKILNLEKIEKCAVLYKKEPKNPHIVAFFTASQKLEITDIRKSLSELLPIYMIPKYIVQIDEMPITTNGKINNKELYNIQIDVSDSNFVPPKTDKQKLFCRILEELLNVQVGITDDLFELGLDSLIAIKFKVELLNNNIDIEYADIFKFHTVKELCDDRSNEIEATPLNNYNYDAINKILSKNVFRNNINIESSINNNILLLGSTGYVGAHILKSFIEKDKGMVYCIVRDKNNTSARTRFIDSLHFYFGTKLDKYIDKRIFILKGDLVKENFGLSAANVNMLKENIQVVINSAANVKHYGNVEKFNSINVGLAQNLISFCKTNNKRLIHLSSLSISGNMVLDGTVNKNTSKTKLDFTERNLYIGQALDNVYTRSKFEAERLILDNINLGLDALILRLGNITNRYSDGFFQINPKENAFLTRVSSLINIGAIPNSILKDYIEFTPVDLCADSIITIMQNYVRNYSVLHIYDYHHVYMDNLIAMLKNSNIKLDVLSDEEFSKLLTKLLKDSLKKKYVSGIINDLSSDKKLSYEGNVNIKSNFSIQFLEKLGFIWQKIDENYILKYVKYLRKNELI